MSIDALLTAGGDDRILIDPSTGRNRYGASSTPSDDEVFLSSSTASTISRRAYAEVLSAWTGLTGANGDRPGIDAWFNDIRSRLLGLFGVPGASVILAGSGTEAELIGLALAKSALKGPLTNIVVAPAETGSGVAHAAVGAYFLSATPFGIRRRIGSRLRGWEKAAIAAQAVEIRETDGALRRSSDVDAEARSRAESAIRNGQNVLLHLLETSKTGRAGVTDRAAARIVAGTPNNVLVYVDCCQLRCSAARVRHLLGLGFIVAITGSKFFGGPSFSAAVLAPATVMQRIARLALPDGLGDFSSRLDWPSDVLTKTDMRWRSAANIGLGLRWRAALSEMDRYFVFSEKLRHAILRRFVSEIRRAAARVERLRELSGGASTIGTTPPSILSFVASHRDGTPFHASETAALCERLRRPRARCAPSQMNKVFHVGQPVPVGGRTALRVCVSAPMVSEVAERVAKGASLEAAFQLWKRDLELLFERMAELIDAFPDPCGGADLRGDGKARHER